MIVKIHSIKKYIKIYSNLYIVIVCSLLSQPSIIKKTKMKAASIALAFARLVATQNCTYYNIKVWNKKMQEQFLKFIVL